MSPKVSIIMSVFNGADTLDSALESLRDQSMSDWELVVCDDASTDDTAQLLIDFAKDFPGQVTVLRNDSNRRLSYSLNRCLGAARGTYIARMDADDLNAPDRLEKQVDFLDQNLEIDLVGSTMRRFDSHGLHDVVPVPSQPTAANLRDGTPFAHGTVMMRAEVFKELGYLVSKRTVRGQDYDLWFRFFASGHTGANLMEPLYFVREDINAIRRRTAKSRFHNWQTAMVGMRALNAPVSWYVRPSLSLLKALIPSHAMRLFRRWQARPIDRQTV